MKIEMPKIPTEVQKERTKNDAELLDNGAEYSLDKEGRMFLSPTDKQVEEARKEMNSELRDNNLVKHLEKGDKILIKFKYIMMGVLPYKSKEFIMEGYEEIKGENDEIKRVIKVSTDKGLCYIKLSDIEEIEKVFSSGK